MSGQEKESLLLIQNSDLSEYSLVNVRGMDAAEIVEALSDMNDDDRLNAAAYLESCVKNQDSSGGIIECIIDGMPAGIGEPVFDKLDACLAKAVMSIGAVKGVEIGDGFEAARMTGSADNDEFCMKKGTVCKKSNHSGGTLHLPGTEDGGCSWKGDLHRHYRPS